MAALHELIVEKEKKDFYFAVLEEKKGAIEEDNFDDLLESKLKEISEIESYDPYYMG